MKAEIGKKYLITTDAWFLAPDGIQYRSVYGTVTEIAGAKETLGIETNKGSTNWYVVIGNMIVAGCQIHYIIQSDACNFARALDYTTKGELSEFKRPSLIYNADA